MLLLDALYPGSPSQLVAACRAAGAAGALGYVWHGGATSHDTGGWTKAHFDALRAGGLVTAPIASVTPGGGGGSPAYQQIIDAARAWGFGRGPLVQDMESPANLPSPAWWNGAIAAFRAAGFKAIKYGNAGDVGGYDNGDGWWKAAYIQTRTDPVPALPPGLVGWQYADMDAIGGIDYDASVFLATLFGGEMETTYIIGVDPEPGGHGIYRWNGSGWDKMPGGAIKVWTDTADVPWCMNDKGALFRWNGGGWQTMPGQGYVPPASGAAAAPHTHPLPATTGPSG